MIVVVVLVVSKTAGPGCLDALMPWTSEIIYIWTLLGSVPFLSSGGRLPEDRLTGTGPLKATVLFLALDHAKLNPLGLEHPSIQLNSIVRRLFAMIGAKSFLVFNEK